MTEHTMTREQRRTVLLRARSHIEASMYALASTIGLDADAMDYLIPDKLWQTDVQGVSKIDDFSDPIPRRNLSFWFLPANWTLRVG